MSNTIESLELEIKANSQSAVDGIEALTQSLDKLRTATKGGLGLSSIAKGMQAIGSANISGAKANARGLVDALSPLSNLSKSNLSSFITPLKNLPKVFSELNKVDMGAFATKMQEVATAMKPLADEMQKVSNGFSAMPTKIQKLINETNKIPKANKKAAGSFTDLYHRIKTVWDIIAKVGTKMWSTIDKSMDYTENMNLFAVAISSSVNPEETMEETTEAMKKAVTDAMGYAEQVSDAMGIDTSEWIRAQGVFQTLATGFGVAGDRATTMSTNLTQLGYDLASFYNMDTETAMLKLKSGLAGELEPLRDIGYDLSQAKLEATALELGITKSVSAMTQAEKAQLRYHAIITQVSTAHGDMAETIKDPANQMRVFKSELNQTAREIGNAFIPILQAVLPTAIAVTKVIGELAKIIAALGGYEAEDPADRIVESTSITQENLEGAQEEAKKLKNYMLGFDELNVINPNTDNALEDTSGWVDFDLPTYQFLPEGMKNDINDIVEKMKEWLGITEDIDSWGELLETRFGNILITIGYIGGALLGWKITKGVLSFIKNFKSFSTGLKALGAFAIIGAAIAGTTYLVNNTEDTMTQIGGLISGASLALGAILAFTGINLPLGIGLMAIGAVSLGSAIAMNTDKLSEEVKGVIATITTSVSLALLALGSILAFTGVNIPLGIALMAGGALTMATAVIPNWNGLTDSVKQSITDMTLMVGGMLLALGALFAFSGANIPLGIGFMLAGAVSLGTAIALNWNAIEESLKGPVGAITGLIGTAVLALGGMLAFSGANIPLGIALMVAGAASLATVVALNWNSIVDAMRGPIGKTVAVVSGALIALGAILLFSGVGIPLGLSLLGAGAVGLVTALAFNWDSMGQVLKTALASILGIISGAMLVLGVLLLLSGAGIGLGLALIFGAVAIGVAAWKLDDNPITRFVKNMVNVIIELINATTDFINEMFHFEFDGLVIGGVQVIPSFDFRLFTIPKIPLLAEGGFPEQGQMFIAREAGAEMVGSIGRRTAVANNDQIVSGIAGGVAEANEEQNVLLREQNSLLRAILEKDSGVYLDGKNLTNSVEKYQRERGRVLISGGVL